MHPVAFTAGEIANALLLILALEVEPPDIGPGVHLVLADLKDVVPVGDLLPDGLAIIQVVAALVDVGEIHGFAQTQAAGIRLLLADDHAEHGGLAGAVGADDAADAAGRQIERDIVNQQGVVKALAHAFGFDHHVAQPRARRDVDFVGLVAGLEFL